MKKIVIALIVCAMVLSACGQTDSAPDLCGTLTIKCNTILENMDKLVSEKKEIVPKNGVIMSEDIEFSEGENLLDILKRELKNRNIHIDFEETTATGSAYVRGIANIYSGDCGELSGWMIRVNGEELTVGCSKYFPRNGDVIEWLYSCDMGKDL